MNKPRAFYHHGFWFMRLKREGQPDLCTKCKYLENAWRDMQRILGKESLG